MLRDLEQIDHAGEAGLTREIRCNVGNGCLEELRYDDFAGRHCITTTDLHVRPLP